MTRLEGLLLVLAILGGVDLAWRGVEVLAALFPRLLSFRARLWSSASDLFTVPFLRRRAVASRTEEVVNQIAFGLQPFLPKGWVRRVRVNWVRSAKGSLLRDGDIVLRIRPGRSADHNLIQALWSYFQTSIFPESRDLLPDDLIAGAALAVARAGLESRHPYLLKEFDEQFLKRIGDDGTAVLNQFVECRQLNEYGLLMGPFFREIDYAAVDARFRPARTGLSDSIKGIQKHMLGFQPLFRFPHKPSEEWVYGDGCSSYGFLLVSKPIEVRPSIEAYVKRAEEHVRRGILRLYVIGRDEERDFVVAVTRTIAGVRALKGVEWYQLNRDYRGNDGGIGAVLALDPLIAGLQIPQASANGLGPWAVNGESRGTPEARVSSSEPHPAVLAQKSAVQVRCPDCEGAVNLAIGLNPGDTSAAECPACRGAFNVHRSGTGAVFTRKRVGHSAEVEIAPPWNNAGAPVVAARSVPITPQLPQKSSMQVPCSRCHRTVVVRIGSGAGATAHAACPACAHRFLVHRSGSGELFARDGGIGASNALESTSPLKYVAPTDHLRGLQAAADVFAAAQGGIVRDWAVLKAELSSRLSDESLASDIIKWLFEQKAFRLFGSGNGIGLVVPPNKLIEHIEWRMVDRLSGHVTAEQLCAWLYGPTTERLEAIKGMLDASGAK